MGWKRWLTCLLQLLLVAAIGTMWVGCDVGKSRDKKSKTDKGKKKKKKKKTGG